MRASRETPLRHHATGTPGPAQFGHTRVCRDAASRSVRLPLPSITIRAECAPPPGFAPQRQHAPVRRHLYPARPNTAGARLSTVRVRRACPRVTAIRELSRFNQQDRPRNRLTDQLPCPCNPTARSFLRHGSRDCRTQARYPLRPRCVISSPSQCSFRYSVTSRLWH